jgi:tetratricopeptide (TPR) repeat protein
MIILIAGLLATAPAWCEESDTTAPAAAEDPWQDPTFQKEFLGSYGVQAEVEPRVTTVEREQMEEILPLLGSDQEAAIEELEKVIRPESSAVFDFTLGNLYFQEDDFDTAAGHYEAALTKFPSFRRAHKNLGLIQVRSGEFSDAIQSLSRVIELGGGDGLAYGLLGYAYSATGQDISAESAYRNALLLQRDVVDWKLGLTQSVFRQKKYEEAVTLCDELLARFPDRADYWLLQANAFIGLKQPLKAAENFEIVQRMGKATVRSQQTLGDTYVNEELWDLAARAYGIALDIDPDQPPAGPMRWIEILAQRGALTHAGDLLARVEETYDGQLDEAERVKLLKLEARLAVAGGEDGGSVDILEEIVSLDPLDGEALILLGQHYAGSDDAEQAIFYYERAASLEDFEADARTRHAQLLVGQSRYAEAVPLLKRAQELKPRDDVARYLEQVERIARTRG